MFVSLQTCFMIYMMKVYFGEESAKQAFETELGRVGETVMLAYGGFTPLRDSFIIITLDYKRWQKWLILCMGMTNKQFQGFIGLALGWLDKALDEPSDNEIVRH